MTNYITSLTDGSKIFTPVDASPAKPSIMGDREPYQIRKGYAVYRGAGLKMKLVMFCATEQEAETAVRELVDAEQAIIDAKRRAKNRPSARS